ncbi:MAG TPA: hemolysin family protein [Phycisphaerales bacterium]|nr:hemolysin family protein [Phycisphaerales bacterium]
MLLAISILAVLLVLNGIFAMSELAVMTSRQSRLQQSARAGSKGAAAAMELAREPTRFLSTVQVGITLIGILAGAFGENALSGQVEPLVAKVPLFAEHADTITLVLVVLVITYFSLVVGELVPKRIALAHPEAVASIISRPLNLLSTVAALPVKVLTFSTELVLRTLGIKPKTGDDVSEDDVRAIIARAAGTGVFTPQELALFQRTMRAGDLYVRDLMVARPDIVWLDESESLEAVRVLLGTSPHSHFPVCRGDIDHLIGVVHIKDLIAYGLLAGTDFKVGSVAQRPLFVPETMPALRLLDQFQQTKNHVAFIVDEFGGTLGMLTLNDVTRAIVGGVARRGDATPSMVRRGENDWLVDGRLPLHDFLQGLGIADAYDAAPDEAPDVSTVGGLIIELLGHIPVEGEKATWRNYTIEVVDMDAARVDKVLVSRVHT